MTVLKDATLPATRVAIYVRLSDEDVAGKSHGIDSTSVQLDDARKAIAREGWTVDERHVYVDDGLSGTKTKRADWQAMLLASRRREFEVMVVRDYDRWARIHPVDALKLIKDLADLGVKLWGYRDRQYLSVEGDQVIFTAIRARQAAAEAEKASERITAGLRARAREERVTGRAPFGYRIRIISEQDVADARKAGDGSLKAGKWWVKYEPELVIVRHIVAVFLETESLAATAGRLNEDGTRPPRGKAWGHASVKMILTRPLMRGYRMHKGERTEHPGLRIFTPEEVKRIDEALARASKNRPWATAERKSATFNLAVPFVACGVCGRGISATGSGSKRMYVCDSHRLRGCRGVGHRSAARVDEAIVRAVDATLTPEALAAVCALVREAIEARPTTSADNRTRLTSEIATTEKRIGNLTEAVAEAPAGVRAPLYAKLGVEQDRLAALRAGLARLDVAPPELDARRTVANVEKRARELRAMLAKGGKDAATAIRVVLGEKRLKAHLVMVDGKRGWKLTGRIGGLYVFDDAHHGSATNQKAEIKGAPVTAGSAPTTAAPASPPVAPSPVASAPNTGTSAGTAPRPA